MHTVKGVTHSRLNKHYHIHLHISWQI